MAAKIITVVFIILAIGLGIFVYQVAVHPKSVGMSSWFGMSASSSLFNFQLNSLHAVQGPAGLPPAQQQTVITSASPTSGSGSTAAPTIDPSQIPPGFTLSQLSPYFHQVRFSSISAGTTNFYGEIMLYDNLNANENIDITGWQIKTSDSGEYIPQAVNLYDPSGLTPETDIVMHTGDTVTLYSSSAPINLRLNECIGYVAHMANFSPQLPMSCPYPNRSAIQNFSGACQNYIESIGTCQAPDMSSIYIPRNDYACQDYLENNFNYKSCFDSHVSDPGFLSSQIWVWTGSNVVDPDHDTVKLFDKNGLLVDYYSY
jgi:tetrahydromethanopterin S-methyltransferase subunit B